MTQEKIIIDHYSRGSLEQSIMAALQSAGRDIGKLSVDDLAPFDEFHIGGRAATAHLMAYLQFQPHHHILDIGCGIGGPARYLAAAARSRITGIDLTPEYCAVAASLTEKTGLGNHIIYRQENALSLPFADDAFDGAYSIHMAMNIADKAALFRQIFRVLKPGSFFGLYDILADMDDGAFSYPVPWAPGPEASFLASSTQMKTLLTESGFMIMAEDDLHGFALLALKKMQDSKTVSGPGLLMGDDFKLKIANLIDNLEKNRCTPRIIICKKKEMNDEQPNLA
ncbi:MAG TPA: class I SAM-dependent methyltransferase [Micavibrio sp.]|jgi:ubiquinone/menaquinone biosynthesis C-methylase UbiE